MASALSQLLAFCHTFFWPTYLSVCSPPRFGRHYFGSGANKLPVISYAWRREASQRSCNKCRQQQNNTTSQHKCLLRTVFCRLHTHSHTHMKMRILLQPAALPPYILCQLLGQQLSKHSSYFCPDFLLTYALLDTNTHTCTHTRSHIPSVSPKTQKFTHTHIHPQHSYALPQMLWHLNCDYALFDSIDCRRLLSVFATLNFGN